MAGFGSVVARCPSPISNSRQRLLFALAFRFLFERSRNVIVAPSLTLPVTTSSLVQKMVGECVGTTRFNTPMLRSVGFQCQLEKLHEFPEKRRPDISVYNYKDGKKLLLDIRVVNPQVPAFCHNRRILPVLRH